jgi:hypothetical protein
MAAVALLDMDIRSRDDPLDVAGRIDRIDCYALAETDLTPYAGLVVPAMADQEHLVRHRVALRDYLDTVGFIVFGGHLHRDWLPGASAFVPLGVRSVRDYEVTFVADHPVFDGVDPHDLTFRRGVAGFFARGHHPPPDGATILTRLSGGQPATYLDEVTTGGTILLQSSCDLLGYASGLDSTAARIPGQLLDWMVAEANRRRGALVEVAR